MFVTRYLRVLDIRGKFKQSPCNQKSRAGLILSGRVGDVGRASRSIGKLLEYDSAMD